MKKLLIAIAAIVFFSCHNNNPESYDESRELVPDPEGYKKDTFIQPLDDALQHPDTVSKANKPVAFKADQQ